MAEYAVTIKFKHINHARAWVNKWVGFADGNDTLSSIIQQVEASFPRDPVVGDEVGVFSKDTNGDYLTAGRSTFGRLTEITSMFYIIELIDGFHAYPKCSVYLIVQDR